MLFEAFGWKPPEFGHLPLIMNSDGTKLSKRQSDIHLQWYKEQGYDPKAVLNFVSLVGGGFKDRPHTTDKLYTLEQFVRMFAMERISTQSVKMEFDRLQDCSRTALKEMLNCPQKQTKFIEQLKALLGDQGLDISHYDRDYLVKLLVWSSDRIHLVKDLVSPKFNFLWVRPNSVPVQDDQAKLILQDTITILECKNEFPKAQEVTRDLKTYGDDKSMKIPRVMKLLRASMTGSIQGAPIGEMVEILGTKEVISRLKNAIKLLHD